ncbi:MAG: FAD-binding oxidoreductase [Gemmataceae bacterium]
MEQNQVQPQGRSAVPGAESCGPSVADELVDKLRAIVGADGLLTVPSELVTYECDGFTLEKISPRAVVFPHSAEQVQQIVRACVAAGVPFLPRGAGTSLAGGTVPVGRAVVIALTRMKRILEVSVRDRYAVVEPGVVNLWLTRRVAGHGFHFAPDPSSQGACTIGGNVATNSGGPHTLKYGVTVNHVLGLEMVLPDGDLIRVGGPAQEYPGADLVGAIVGCEGTFGIVTKIWVRLTRNPQGYRTLLGIFETVDDATNTISDIIGAGILPAALEMMDRLIIQAVEDAFGFGFPRDAGAVLIIEVDGLEPALDEEAQRIVAIAQRHRVRDIRQARDEQERQLLWKCRKQAFGAVGRLAPSYCTQDGVVPRTQLPHMLRYIQQVSQKYGIPICNVFHAGDGNLHPILLFDERDADACRRVLAASDEIMRECLRLGGSVTGEHGIGVEKINYMAHMFTPEDLDMMLRLRKVFNPDNWCSPGKMFPTGGVCLEVTKPGRRAPL